MLFILVNRDLLMLTPSPSWVCPHGSWLMTSNTNGPPAQVVITFTKLPVSVVQSLLTHLSSPLPNSPDSQFPSPNKPYLLILLRVDSTMTVRLIRSPTLLLKWSVSKGLIERVSFLVFWRIYIFTVNILYMGQVWMKVHILCTCIFNFSSTIYWKTILPSLNWLYTIPGNQLSLCGRV